MNEQLTNSEILSYFDLPKKVYHLKGVQLRSKIGKGKSEKNGRIWVDDIEVLPEMAHALRPFYDSRFEWGELGGNATFTAALSVCLAIFREERLAENIFVRFEEEFVQLFSKGDFDVTIDLTDFLKTYQSRFHPHLHSYFCFSSIFNCREVYLYIKPDSGEIVADLAENYDMHNMCLKNDALRKLHERKRRLIFSIFKKHDHVVRGTDFSKVMEEVGAIFRPHYYRALDKIIKKQFSQKIK